MRKYIQQKAAMMFNDTEIELHLQETNQNAQQ